MTTPRAILPSAPRLLLPTAIGTWIVLLAAGAFLQPLGPDQARDVRIVEDLLAGIHYPLEGPPLRNAFRMGPLFYYLVATVHAGLDRLWSVGLAFAVLWLVCIAVFTRFLGRTAGPWAGMFAWCLLPPWSVFLYANSPWNPALVYPLTALFVAALLGAREHDRPGAWFAAGALLGILPQMHASTLPLAGGALLLALRRPWPCIPRRLFLLAAGCTLVSLPWLYGELVRGFPNLNALLHGGGDTTLSWHKLVDPAKWRDLALLLPAACPEGVPACRVGAALWLPLAAGLALVGIGAATARRRSPALPVALVGGLWLVASMASLDGGFAYYLDPFWPWLAACAACGFARLAARLPATAATLLAAAVLAASALPPAAIYLRLVRGEPVALHLGALYFPHLTFDRDDIMPWIPWWALRRYYHTLQALGVRPDHVVGTGATVLREYDKRLHYDAALRRTTAPPTGGSRLLLVHPDELPPAWRKGRMEILDRFGEFLLLRPPAEFLDSCRLDGRDGPLLAPADDGPPHDSFPPPYAEPRYPLPVECAPAHAPRLLWISSRCADPLPADALRLETDGEGPRAPAYHFSLTRFLTEYASRFYDLPPGAEPIRLHGSEAARRCDLTPVTLPGSVIECRPS